MAKKSTFLKVTARILLIFFAVFVIAAATFLIPAFHYAKTGAETDLAEQRARVEALRDNAGAPVDEQSFADFDLTAAAD
ncbi:MAG: hypothetical protein LBT20_08805, partial [Clostridiales bacterium]|nr:hypothetical protein [Clostridiales bacterium]